MGNAVNERVLHILTFISVSGNKTGMRKKKKNCGTIRKNSCETGKESVADKKNERWKSRTQTNALVGQNDRLMGYN